MRTAVLIHGFHLDSKLTLKHADGAYRTYDWHDLAIGTIGPNTATGRATFGTLLAYAEDARLVVFSTGASSKDGVSEARYTYQAVQKRAEWLAKVLRVPVEKLRLWLEPRVELDETSQTTQEELERNLKRCVELDITKVILVTNRFHAPRALANANVAQRKLGLAMVIMATSPEDLSPPPTIFEPPTRPDRPSLLWNELLQGVFKLPPERQAAAFERIAAALKLDDA
ncbi:MAG: YdcF family protein [Patescibacteria group bacterium]